MKSYFVKFFSGFSIGCDEGHHNVTLEQKLNSLLTIELCEN